MNILWEISEKSNDLITLLDINGFFNKPQFKHFCPKARLKIELELKMKENWESKKNFNLTNREFETIVKSIIQEEISDTLYDLIDSGKIQMSVNSSGNIVYHLAKSSNHYFEYKDGILKLFRNNK